ncbi:hypothetical protein A9165_09335 [Alishewanella sp. HH-ZS]|nr:hypothetical protein A9165_09335 [Alishewanella sp. HH-ZS]
MLAVPESQPAIVELALFVDVEPSLWRRNAALSLERKLPPQQNLHTEVCVIQHNWTYFWFFLILI